MRTIYLCSIFAIAKSMRELSNVFTFLRNHIGIFKPFYARLLLFQMQCSMLVSTIYFQKLIVATYAYEQKYMMVKQLKLKSLQ